MCFCWGIIGIMQFSVKNCSAFFTDTTSVSYPSHFRSTYILEFIFCHCCQMKPNCAFDEGLLQLKQGPHVSFLHTDNFTLLVLWPGPLPRMTFMIPLSLNLKIPPSDSLRFIAFWSPSSYLPQLFLVIWYLSLIVGFPICSWCLLVIWSCLIQTFLCSCHLVVLGLRWWLILLTVLILRQKWSIKSSNDRTNIN